MPNAAPKVAPKVVGALRGQARAGAQTAQRIKLAVCILARNCARRIPGNLRTLRALTKHFADARIYILEDGSTDATREVLEQCAAADPRIRLYGEPLIEAVRLRMQATHTAAPKKIQQKQYGAAAAQADDDLFVGPIAPYREAHAEAHSAAFARQKTRMERMALLRESILSAVEDDGFAPDVLMQLDIDVRNFSISGVLHCLASYGSWDAVFANGRMFSFCQNYFAYNLFYDSYALIPAEHAPVEAYVTRIHNQHRFAPLAAGEPLYPVRSAFGGIGLYAYNTMRGVSYYHSAAADNFEVCEHVSFHRALARRGVRRMYINPALTLYYNTFAEALLYAFGVKRISYGGAGWRFFIGAAHLALLPFIGAYKLCNKLMKRRAATS